MVTIENASRRTETDLCYWQSLCILIARAGRRYGSLPTVSRSKLFSSVKDICSVVKVNITPWHAAQSQGMDGDIAATHSLHAARTWWVISNTPPLLYPWERPGTRCTNGFCFMLHPRIRLTMLRKTTLSCNMVAGKGWECNSAASEKAKMECDPALSPKLVMNEKKWMKIKYTWQNVKVRLDRGETRSVQIGRGARQGCCLSPILSNLNS